MVCANWGIRTALVPIQLSVENFNNTRQALTSKALGQLRSRAPQPVPAERQRLLAAGNVAVPAVWKHFYIRACKYLHIRSWQLRIIRVECTLCSQSQELGPCINTEFISARTRQGRTWSLWCLPRAGPRAGTQYWGTGGAGNRAGGLKLKCNLGSWAMPCDPSPRLLNCNLFFFILSNSLWSDTEYSLPASQEQGLPSHRNT